MTVVNTFFIHLELVSAKKAVLTVLSCRAYIECSAKEMRGLSPILQEAYRCAVLDPGAAGGSATNGHGGFGGFPSIIRKKNSAPSFLFNSSSSSLSPSASGSSGTPGNLLWQLLP